MIQYLRINLQKIIMHKMNFKTDNTFYQKGVLMFFKVFNSLSPGFLKVFIKSLMIILYVTTLYSCTTTELFNKTPESLESGYSGKITKIELKNGNFIICKGKIVKFENVSDTTGFIVILSADTVKTVNNRNDIQMKELRIAKTDVLKIQLEKTETDTANTVLLILGIAAGAALAYFAVLVIAINAANLK